MTNTIDPRFRSPERFEYECRTPDCDGIMHGDYDEPVTCPECFTRYETAWDMDMNDRPASTLGKEIDSPTAIGAVCREEGCHRVLDDVKGVPAWCGDCDPMAEYRGSDR